MRLTRRSRLSFALTILSLMICSATGLQGASELAPFCAYVDQI